MFRIGMGTDSHAFVPAKGKRLMLGGVHIDHPDALQGDSDGDVLLHAAFNAIMSAIGDRGLGHYFNKNNMDRYGASEAILGLAMEKATEKGYRVNNVSITVEGQQPRLEKHIPAMQKRIGEILNVEPDCVGITVTSGETLSAFGKGEGIYGQAVILLYKK